MPKTFKDRSVAGRHTEYTKAGDGTSLQAAAAKASSAFGTRETDPHRLSQRLRQIEYGYNTLGYENYARLVPKHTRTAEHPRTPNRFKVMSKRAWDGLVRKWRRQLHEYDDAGNAAATGPAAALSSPESGRDAKHMAVEAPVAAYAPPSDDEEDEDEESAVAGAEAARSAPEADARGGAHSMAAACAHLKAAGAGVTTSAGDGDMDAATTPMDHVEADAAGAPSRGEDLSAEVDEERAVHAGEAVDGPGEECARAGESCWAQRGAAVAL